MHNQENHNGYGINPFRLERYFAEYEFKVQYLLSPSDCESLTLAELVAWADPGSRALWDNLALSYTESQGHPILRQEIAGLYQQVAPEQVMVAAPEEGIFIAMQTLLKPGDHVIAIFPAYQSLYELARSTGCELSFWELELQAGRWALDLQRLADSFRRNTRMVVINFPHNPTGYLPDAGQLQGVVDLARQHGCYLFSDEMYRLLEYAPAERLPAVCDLYERGISLSGLSKSYALPGLRLGWLAARQPGLIDRWLAYKDYTTICSSAPSEVLGIMALQLKERIPARNLDIIQDNLVTARAFFNRYPELFQWVEPRAGSVAFPRWTGPGRVEAFCQSLLDQQGVMVVPGSIFEHPGSHFRLGLGRKNLPEGLERVGAYLEGVS